MNERNGGGEDEVIDWEKFAEVKLPFENEKQILKYYSTDKVAWSINPESFNVSIWKEDIRTYGKMHEEVDCEGSNRLTKGYIGKNYFQSYFQQGFPTVFGVDGNEFNRRAKKFLQTYFENLEAKLKK